MGTEIISESTRKHYRSYINLVNATLADYLLVTGVPYKTVSDAMKYSVEIGGKRIRPLLVLEFCRLCGGNASDALPFACALEMIHTYSLVHDDLPAMDNDTMRRGKESTWKKYGEAFGILAGDGLLTQAFAVASSAGVDAHTTVQCIRLLSDAAGIHGMIGGQTLDLKNERSENISIARLEETHRLKTGALIRCACELGCTVADATTKQFAAAREYADNLGLAFQIIDDILDVTGDPEMLGKEVGQDTANNKTTYVTLLGVDGADKLAEDYTQKALMALSVFENTKAPEEATRYLLCREY